MWGQLVSHDIAYTLPISGYSQCCQAMFQEEQHPECLPVVMPDYVCQEYVRSAIGLKPGCLLGPRYATYTPQCQGSAFLSANNLKSFKATAQP